MTAIERGSANTRWRDFADIYLLSRQCPVDGHDLQQALAAVAGHRKAALVSMEDALPGFAELAGARWRTWTRRQNLATRLPTEFGSLLDAIGAFADPAIAGTVTTKTWNPTELGWSPNQL